MEIRCNDCGFEGEPEKFEPAISVNYDFRCPVCTSLSINTASLLEVDPEYGFGKDNFFELPPLSEVEES